MKPLSKLLRIQKKTKCWFLSGQNGAVFGPQCLTHQITAAGHNCNVLHQIDWYFFSNWNFLDGNLMILQSAMWQKSKLPHWLASCHTMKQLHRQTFCSYTHLFHFKDLSQQTNGAIVRVQFDKDTMSSVTCHRFSLFQLCMDVHSQHMDTSDGWGDP